MNIINFLIILLLFNNYLCEIFKANEPFNMTIDDMDKMMTCSLYLNQKLDEDKKIIENTSLKFNNNKTKEQFEIKLYNDIFEYCFNNINSSIINKFFFNLTYLEPAEFKFYLEQNINYSNYLHINLTLNKKQEDLVYKLEKVREIFEQKNILTKYENSKKIKIGTIDINDISKTFKIFLIVIVLLMFVIIIYLLNNLINKKKNIKKKKKKK